MCLFSGSYPALRLYNVCALNGKYRFLFGEIPKGCKSLMRWGRAQKQSKSQGRLLAHACGVCSKLSSTTHLALFVLCHQQNQSRCYTSNLREKPQNQQRPDLGGYNLLFDQSPRSTIVLWVYYGAARIADLKHCWTSFRHA